MIDKDFYLPFSKKVLILETSPSQYVYYSNGLKCWRYLNNRKEYITFQSLLDNETKKDYSYNPGHYQVLNSFVPVTTAMKNRQFFYETMMKFLSIGLLRFDTRISLNIEKSRRESDLMSQYEEQLKYLSDYKKWWPQVNESTIQLIQSIYDDELKSLCNKYDLHKPCTSEQRILISIIWDYADVTIQGGKQCVIYHPWRPYRGGPN